MVDRVALITTVSKKIKLSPSTSLKFNQALEKALALLLPALSLPDARQLSEDQRGELAFAIRDVLTLADLKKIAKQWDPKRAIEVTSSQTEICTRLLDLLRGKSEPYFPISVSLAQAQGLNERDKSDLLKIIGGIAPVGDLRKLAKKWDKQNEKLLAASKPDLGRALTALLEGMREPLPAPEKANKRKKAA